MHNPNSELDYERNRLVSVLRNAATVREIRERLLENVLGPPADVPVEHFDNDRLFLLFASTILAKDCHRLPPCPNEIHVSAEISALFACVVQFHLTLYRSLR